MRPHRGRHTPLTANAYNLVMLRSTFDILAAVTHFVARNLMLLICLLWLVIACYVNVFTLIWGLTSGAGPIECGYPWDAFVLVDGGIDRVLWGGVLANLARALFPLLLFYLLKRVVDTPSRRRRYREENNLCISCGYDLRGTDQLCPECGAVAAKSA